MTHGVSWRIFTYEMSRVKELREAKGLRREDVAAKAGISYDYVRRLEVDNVNPGLDIARAVAKVLGSTVDKVFPPAPEPATAGRK